MNESEDRLVTFVVVLPNTVIENSTVHLQRFTRENWFGSFYSSKKTGRKEDRTGIEGLADLHFTARMISNKRPFHVPFLNVQQQHQQQQQEEEERK